MRVFIWTRVDKVTESHHQEGGVVVFAADLEDARTAIREQLPDGCGAMSCDPDESYDVSGADAHLLIFPDEGCC